MKLFTMNCLGLKNLSFASCLKEYIQYIKKILRSKKEVIDVLWWNDDTGGKIISIKPWYGWVVGMPLDKVWLQNLKDKFPLISVQEAEKGWFIKGAAQEIAEHFGVDVDEIETKRVKDGGSWWYIVGRKKPKIIILPGSWMIEVHEEDLEQGGWIVGTKQRVSEHLNVKPEDLVEKIIYDTKTWTSFVACYLLRSK